MYLQRALVVPLQSAQRVQPTRAGRSYLLMQNRGPGNVFLGLGDASAATVDDGFRLCPGASLELSDGRPDMAVYAVADAAAKLVMVEG